MQVHTEFEKGHFRFDVGLLANHYVFESEIHLLIVFSGFSGISMGIPENKRHKTA